MMLGNWLFLIVSHAIVLSTLRFSYKFSKSNNKTELLAKRNMLANPSLVIFNIILPSQRPTQLEIVNHQTLHNMTITC